MTTAQVGETSVTVNNNSPIQDHVHPDDQTQPTFENYSRWYVDSSINKPNNKANLKSHYTAEHFTLSIHIFVKYFS